METDLWKINTVCESVGSAHPQAPGSGVAGLGAQHQLPQITALWSLHKGRGPPKIWASNNECLKCGFRLFFFLICGPLKAFQQGYRIPFKIWRFLCSICELFFLSPLSWSPRELLKMLALGDQTSSGSVNQTGETNSRDKTLPETPSGLVRKDKLEVQVPAGQRGRDSKTILNSWKEKAATWRNAFLWDRIASSDCAVTTADMEGNEHIWVLSCSCTSSSIHLHKITRDPCSSVGASWWSATDTMRNSWTITANST